MDVSEDKIPLVNRHVCARNSVSERAAYSALEGEEKCSMSFFAKAGLLEQLPWTTGPEQLLASLRIFDSGLLGMCASLRVISSSLIAHDIMIL